MKNYLVEFILPQKVWGTVVKTEGDMVYCEYMGKVYIRNINDIVLQDTTPISDSIDTVKYENPCDVVLPPKETRQLSGGLNIKKGEISVEDTKNTDDYAPQWLDMSANTDEDDMGVLDEYIEEDIKEEEPVKEVEIPVIYQDDNNYTQFVELSKKYNDTVSLFKEEYYEYYKINKKIMQLHRVLMHEPYANNPQGDVMDKVNALWDRFDVYLVHDGVICKKLENIRHLAYILLMDCRPTYEKYTINNGFYNFFDTEPFAKAEYTALKDIYIDVWDRVAGNLNVHEDFVQLDIQGGVNYSGGIVIYHSGYNTKIGTSMRVDATKGVLNSNNASQPYNIEEVSINHDIEDMSSSKVKFAEVELPFEPGTKEDLDAIEDLYNAHLIAKDTRQEVSVDEQEHLNKLLAYAKTANVVNTELSKAYGSFSIPMDVIKNTLTLDIFYNNLSEAELEELKGIVDKYNSGESLGWIKHEFLEKAKADAQQGK